MDAKGWLSNMHAQYVLRMLGRGLVFMFRVGLRLMVVLTSARKPASRQSRDSQGSMQYNKQCPLTVRINAEGSSEVGWMGLTVLGRILGALKT